MRSSLVNVPPKLLTRATAWGYVLANQLATPGLGTFLAGRRMVGFAQATLAMIGFILVISWVLWFVLTCLRTFAVPPNAGPFLRTGICGAALFVIAWFWALASSISILREARNQMTKSQSPSSKEYPISNHQQ